MLDHETRNSGLRRLTRAVRSHARPHTLIRRVPEGTNKGNNFSQQPVFRIKDLSTEITLIIVPPRASKRSEHLTFSLAQALSLRQCRYTQPQLYCAYRV